MRGCAPELERERAAIRWHEMASDGWDAVGLKPRLNGLTAAKSTFVDWNKGRQCQSGRPIARIGPVSEGRLRGEALSRGLQPLGSPAYPVATNVCRPQFVFRQRAEVKFHRNKPVGRSSSSEQVHQAILNLGTNAVHAMHGRPGVIAVRLESASGRPQSRSPAPRAVRISSAATARSTRA